MKNIENVGVEESSTVKPYTFRKFNSTDVLFYHASKAARSKLNLQKGDSVVMTGGMTNGNSGNTNTIVVETI